jgi:hypothetical protein
VYQVLLGVCGEEAVQAIGVLADQVPRDLAMCVFVGVGKGCAQTRFTSC